MPSHRYRRPAPWFSAALLTSLALAACSNANEGEDEPQVASIRLTVGTQTINISDNGTVTGGPITITRPATPAITAGFLRADGTPDPVAGSADFELSATSGNTAVLTFTRSSAFAGTLTGVAAGSTHLTVGLYHKIENHEDFGPFTVPVTVN